MAKFHKLLTAKGLVNWAILRKHFGMDLTAPKDEDERRIHLEGKIESVEEIDRLMRKPGKGAWHG